MMKCPEKEKISLYVDGELAGKELDNLRAHLETCPACRKEAESMNLDAEVLREGIDRVFVQHRMTEKIMSEIRNSPLPVNDAAPAIGWWQRILLPALAFALVVMMFMFLYPSQQKFYGCVTSVSFQAVNNESTVDGVTVMNDHRFQLQAPESKTLKGSFLFYVGSENPSEFVMTGNAQVSLSDKMQTVFSDAVIELDRFKGTGLQVIVNDKLVYLTNEIANYKSFAALETDNISCASCTETLVASQTPETASISLPVSAGVKPVAIEIITPASLPAVIATEVVPVEPASGVDYITNPFTDQPLGAGK